MCEFCPTPEQERLMDLRSLGEDLATSVRNFIEWWDYDTPYDRTEDGPPLVETMRAELAHWEKDCYG